MATSGVAFPQPHPLYEFCDTGLHQACLVTWEHRRQFSEGYAGGIGNILSSTPDWNLRCGPLMYGPYGRPGWPYYAEIRLMDWPIRLYSRFENWGQFVSSRAWEPDFITEINEAVEKLYPQFPQTDSELREYLWLPLLESMLSAPEHRSRYIATVTLNLYDDEKLRSAIPQLEQARHDPHGSIRNAAHLILKRIDPAPGQI